MRARITCLAVVLLVTAGCVTSGEGARMRAELAGLRDRIDGMDRRDAEINEQVARLRKVLDEATALLSRNSADLGTKVARNETEFAAVTGQIEEAKHVLDDLQKRVNEQSNRLAALEQTQNKIVDRVAPSIPADRDSLWKEAQTRLTGGQRPDARRFFAEYIKRYPQDPRSPQAQIFLGQSYAADGNHTAAAAEFLKVVDVYPKSSEVPEAMWLLAQSYVELHFCSDARVLLSDIARRYPRSPRSTDVKVKLRELQKIAKDKRLCTS